MIQTCTPISTIQELREHVKQARLAGKRIGFVPTMGYLHDGHVSLVTAARERCDVVVMSIFVNPLQFGPHEDFDRYPRDLERDCSIAAKAGVDLLFAPSVAEMYPQPILTNVSVAKVSEPLCGRSRPGHFDGVATVVLKLFQIVQPDEAFFGQKDAQQLAVIEQMVADLSVPVRIVPCPIVREADGLAMSSRNVYLSPEEREQAVVLYQSLRRAESWLRPGEEAAAIRERLVALISEKPLAEIDYVEILTYPRLTAIDRLEPGMRVIVALAVRFGKTRLIDNLIVTIE